ncbi:MAG: zinc transporter ZntB [Croceibacterium sp.]
MDARAQATDDLTADGPLLFGRLLDGQGGARPIGWAEVQTWRPGVPGELMWLHLRRTADGVQQWLQEALAIPEPTAELLTGDATRPRAFREGHILVATLRGINFNPGAQPEDMVSMQLWCDGTRLVTLRRSKLQTPRDTLAELDSGHGPRDAGALVTNLIEQLVTKMNSAIVGMNEEIDRLEAMEPAETDPDGMLVQISTIRRNCLALQRHMAPQHVALEEISRDAPDWFEGHDRREIGETIALLRRFLDDIDISKESAVVLLDELRSRAVAKSERTNYKLTIVAAIFLPLSFLTGLLGINVAGIPGSAAGEPDAFWFVCGLCVAILLVQLWLFRRWKWL